jgi:hypothetical protein
MTARDQWLARLAKLNIDRSRGPAPHKPLLLLAVLTRLDEGEGLPAVLPLTPELAFRFQTLWAFLGVLAGTEADAFVISGDTGESHDLGRHLTAIGEAVRRPVSFVLGNHDFYQGSIAGVRGQSSHSARPRRTSAGFPTRASCRSPGRRAWSVKTAGVTAGSATTTGPACC